MGAAGHAVQLTDAKQPVTVVLLAHMPLHTCWVALHMTPLPVDATEVVVEPTDVCAEV